GPELDELIELWTTDLDQWEVTRQLQAVGVPSFPSLDARMIEDDPHLAVRGVVERLDHPVVGAKSHIGIPWLSHDGPNGVRAPAPMLGADTDDVLRGLLEMSDDEVQRLRALGVLQ
ncbi:MAG: CoA transferase, partial [Actinomycetota bacterium]|nr:CoA transferase [Actinomycetota bacterium]